MSKYFLPTALALALPFTASAAPRVFPVDAKPVLEDHYPVHVTQWPGGVTSLADVTYSTIPGYRPLIVDIYMPPKKAGPKPLVLFIHGGGWVAGHTRHSGALANFPPRWHVWPVKALSSPASNTALPPRLLPCTGSGRPRRAAFPERECGTFWH
jgi:hypothetical protein